MLTTSQCGKCKEHEQHDPGEGHAGRQLLVASTLCNLNK